MDSIGNQFVNYEISSAFPPERGEKATVLYQNESISLLGEGEEWDQAVLIMQTDGNLVIYLDYENQRVPIWATGELGYLKSGYRLEMRKGHLSLLTGPYGEKLAWCSDNWNSPGSYFTLEKSPFNIARIAIYSSTDQLVWDSDRNGVWQNVSSWE